MKDLILKFLSRKWIVAVAAFVLGNLQSLGITVEADLADKVVGAAIAVAAVVAYILGNVWQKKVTQ